MIITLLLIAMWASATIMGVLIISMGYFLGSRYVFTTQGISRLGPNIKSQLGNYSFQHQGKREHLKAIISSTQPTILIFTTGFTETHVVEAVISFARANRLQINVLIFCEKPSEQHTQLLGSQYSNDIGYIPLSDDELRVRLGIRVTPFALLVNNDGKLLSKGLVNNAVHLCLLVMTASHHIENNQLKELKSTCEEYVETYSNHTSLIRNIQ